MISITKLYAFEAAHQLPNHRAPDGSPGQCSRLHGHSYRLEVTVTGEQNEDDQASAYGMILDFHDLSTVVKEKITGKLDQPETRDEFYAVIRQ